MGENPRSIHLVGSPAIDALASIPVATDAEHRACGSPDYIFLMHPVGRSNEAEEVDARVVLEALCARGRVLALSPNSDPGRDGIARAIAVQSSRGDRVCGMASLSRAQFVGLGIRALDSLSVLRFEFGPSILVHAKMEEKGRETSSSFRWQRLMLPSLLLTVSRQ
jgi:hypothetical protein